MLKRHKGELVMRSWELCPRLTLRCSQSLYCGQKHGSLRPSCLLKLRLTTSLYDIWSADAVWMTWASVVNWPRELLVIAIYVKGRCVGLHVRTQVVKGHVLASSPKLPKNCQKCPIFIHLRPLGAGSTMFSGCLSVRPYVCVSTCVHVSVPKFCEHHISQTAWGNFAKFTVLVHLGTKVND